MYAHAAATDWAAVMVQEAADASEVSAGLRAVLANNGMMPLTRRLICHD